VTFLNHNIVFSFNQKQSITNQLITPYTSVLLKQQRENEKTKRSHALSANNGELHA